MSAAVAAARTLADVIVAPVSAWRRLAAASNVAWLCVWVGALHSVLAAAHAHHAWAALASEAHEWAADTRQGVAFARVAMVAIVPLWTVARAFALAAVFGLAAAAPRRRRVALALALEAVPVLEGMALAATTAAVRPAGVEALRAVQLRAGLDAFWHLDGWPAAVLGAANIFSVWWAVLFVTGAVRVLGASWRRACAFGFGLWTLRVVWRAVWTASP